MNNGKTCVNSLYRLFEVVERIKSCLTFARTSGHVLYGQILSDIEVMHMIRKGQMQVKKGTQPSVAGQFYRW
jgi:hypothetical protein